jgi:phage-related protein
MPRIGPACHELRIRDDDQTWRIVYHIALTEIVVLDVFKKKMQRTDKAIVERCQARLRAYVSAR